MSGPGRHEEEEQADEERWLITYADMITLLMAFFIMMYSMSVVDLQKFEALSESARHVFGGNVVSAAAKSAIGPGLLDGGASLMAGVSGPARNQASLVNEIKRELDTWLPEKLRADIEVTHSAGLVTISIKADTLTFPVGEADLTPEMREILDVLGPSLRESLAPLLVEGHTCDLPISTARFPSNWELSAQRATNVMVHLIRGCGIDPDHISAVGYADTRPLAPNDSAANRVRNRRVDIVVLTETGGPGTSLAGDGEALDGNASLRLRPVRLFPTVDLRTRYYEHTGRRSADTSSSVTRREVQSCD